MRVYADFFGRLINPYIICFRKRNGLRFFISRKKRRFTPPVDLGGSAVKVLRIAGLFSRYNLRGPGKRFFRRKRIFAGRVRALYSFKNSRHIFGKLSLNILSVVYTVILFGNLVFLVAYPAGTGIRAIVSRRIQIGGIFFGRGLVKPSDRLAPGAQLVKLLHRSELCPLRLCKLGIHCFKAQRLFDVFALIEPKDKIVAFPHAVVHPSGFGVKLGKLILILLVQLVLLILLKYIYKLVVSGAARLVKLI